MDDDDIPADLRALFDAEKNRDDGPPPGAKERVSHALSISLGIGIGAAATSAAASTMAATSASTSAAATTAAATTTAAAATAATTTAASVAATSAATSAVVTTGAGAGFTATGGALAKGLAFMFATAVAGTTGTGIYLAAREEPAPIVEVAPPSVDVPSTFDPSALGKRAPPPPPPRVEKPRAPLPLAPLVAPAPVVERAIEAPAVPVTQEQKAERLRGERAVLDEARTAVARNDGGAALIALEAHRASYADGMLIEERDALTILALAKVNRVDDARRKAEQFRAKYPRSLFTPAIDGAVPSEPR